jgi:putative transposase
MVKDPAEYRWSSYGEAMGATGRSGAKAKAGLVRAVMADKGWEPTRGTGRAGFRGNTGCCCWKKGAEKTREVVNAAASG